MQTPLQRLLRPALLAGACVFTVALAGLPGRAESGAALEPPVVETAGARLVEIAQADGGQGIEPPPSGKPDQIPQPPADAPTPPSDTPPVQDDRPVEGPERGETGETPDVQPPPGQPGGEEGAPPTQPTPPRTRPAPRPAVRYEAKTTPPKLEVAAGTVSANLYFKPVDPIVEPGSTFTLQVMLNNAGSTPVDAFDFTVLYDPRWATLRQVDFASLGGHIAGAAMPDGPVDLASTPNLDLRWYDEADESLLGVGARSGSLRLSAEFSSPIVMSRKPLAEILFIASENAGRTPVRFLRPPEGVSAVFHRGRNILGQAAGGFSGLLDTNLTLRRRETHLGVETTTETTKTAAELGEAMPWELPDKDEEMRLPMWSQMPPFSSPDAEASIALQAPQNRVFRAGEEFWLDLVLLNGESAIIEAVSASVLYDPLVFEVVDMDEGNWIARGVNAWDGGFHETYPFDVHAANRADNARGVLRYAAARHTEGLRMPSGVFARIRMRALRAADASAVRLARQLPHDDQPSTYVRAFGFDRMTDRWESDGVPGVVLRVVPGAQAAAE